MQDLPANWAALCALVLLLGMRHGIDADHLAAIDGLTRLGTQHRRPWARWCGALFSLGHGTVVVATALSVGLVRQRWAAPPWLETLGAWISIGFLLLLGLANLRAVFLTPPGTPVSLVSVKGRMFERVMHARHPLAVAGVGALFALSFDTVSQTVLFAATGTQFGGAGRSLVLGLLFLLGMLVTDGLNGWWMSGLIARADGAAAIASRVMGVAVAGASLLTAGLGLARQASPLIDAWSDGKELALGAAVVAVMAASFIAARALGRVRPAGPGSG